MYDPLIKRRRILTRRRFLPRRGNNTKRRNRRRNIWRNNLRNLNWKHTSPNCITKIYKTKISNSFEWHKTKKILGKTDVTICARLERMSKIRNRKWKNNLRFELLCNCMWRWLFSSKVKDSYLKFRPNDLGVIFF